MDDLKIAELAKRIKYTDMQPMEIKRELNKLINEYEPEYVVCFHPFDPPVPLDEAVRRILKNNERILEEIDKKTDECSCDCCREIQKFFPPAVAIG